MVDDGYLLDNNRIASSIDELETDNNQLEYLLKISEFERLWDTNQYQKALEMIKVVFLDSFLFLNVHCDICIQCPRTNILNHPLLSQYMKGTTLACNHYVFDNLAYSIYFGR
jgi:hypothetical protein